MVFVLVSALVQVGLLIAIFAVHQHKAARRSAVGLAPPELAIEVARTLGGRGVVEPGGEGMVLDLAQRRLRLVGTDSANSVPQTLYLGVDALLAAPGPAVSSPFRDGARAGGTIPRLPHLVLRRETERDAWGRRLGLNDEPQTGDPAFDDAVYVEHAGDRVGARALLSRPELRVRALALVDDATDVVFNAQGLAVAVRWRSCGPRSPEAYWDVASKLVALADVVPPVRDLILRPRTHVEPSGVLFAVPVFLLFMLTNAGLAKVLQRPPIDVTFYWVFACVALLSVAAFAAVAWKLSKGRSRGLARFVGSVAAIVGLVPAGAFVVLALVNSSAVTGEHVERVQVGEVVGVQSKSGARCHVRVAPWRSGLVFLDQAPTSCGNWSLRPSAMGEVRVRTGRLGFSWIENVDVQRG